MWQGEDCQLKNYLSDQGTRKRQNGIEEGEK